MTSTIYVHCSFTICPFIIQSVEDNDFSSSFIKLAFCGLDSSPSLSSNGEGTQSYMNSSAKSYSLTRTFQSYWLIPTFLLFHHFFIGSLLFHNFEVFHIMSERVRGSCCSGNCKCKLVHTKCIILSNKMTLNNAQNKSDLLTESKKTPNPQLQLLTHFAHAHLLISSFSKYYPYFSLLLPYFFISVSPTLSLLVSVELIRGLHFPN